MQASVRLSRSGQLAELFPDTLTHNGVVLSIGGAEQSHVEVDDPSFLLHDYIRRMRSIITAGFGDERPSNALHLGAGALTLPRWLQHWQPGLAQTVVDYEPELVEFVLQHLPMHPKPESVVDDAAAALIEQLAGRAYDLVVVDLFNSDQAPGHLTTAEFFENCLARVSPRGLLVVNFGDDAGMRFARRLTSTMVSVLGPGALLAAPDEVLGGGSEGNLVLAAAARGFSQGQQNMIWAAGPHPGSLLSGDELIAWTGS